MILYAVYFYVRFPVSYRDLEEIMAERGVDLDHATLNRWVEKYAGAIAEEAHRWKSPTIVRTPGELVNLELSPTTTGLQAEYRGGFTQFFGPSALDSRPTSDAPRHQPVQHRLA